ncbi:MAG: transketolase C-terminal domain-containing protein [Oscillospiraceae bacterium]
MVGNFRDELGKTFEALGEAFPTLAVVTADVSKSTRSIKFKEKWPERFFSVGIAEANAVSIAAGIASFGHPVIFTAYGVFACEKPFEQIRNTLCYPQMNVKIVATHGGISVGEDGATHQAVEDIAIMRAIPGMKVIVAADPGEVKAAVFEAVRTEGPVYVRLGRSVGAVLHDDPDKVTFEMGKAEVLASGKDVSLMGVGIMVAKCIEAAEMLKQDGIDASVINIRSVKPIDETTIINEAKRTGAIVTAEDHNCFGGLFGAVCEVVGRNCPVAIERVALENTFGESGNGELLLEKYGLTALSIYERAKTAVLRKTQEVK